jgi:hypothetical protein
VLSSSSTYKQAIHGPHKTAFAVDLLDGPGGAVLARDVPVFSGSIKADLTHRVTRSGTFTVGPQFWPDENAAGLLTPVRTVARVRAGIRYGNGSTELFPIIVGRVGDLVRNDDGSVTARVDDLAADVVGFRFEQPRTSENVPVTTQIRRLILEALPEATFGVDDVTDAPTPRLVWDEDRGDALDKLSEAVAGRWFALGDGSFVVRRYAYDVGTPVQDIRDSDDGLLVSATPMLSRDGAANSITVVVERFDGGTPFRVTVRDTSASSPTRFGGPFGRVSQIIKVQTPLTLGEATTYARAQLNASTALLSTWNISCVPDFTLEPGDTIRTQSRGVRSTQLIDSITYPLGPGTMTLGTRAYVRAQASAS